MTVEEIGSIFIDMACGSRWQRRKRLQVGLAAAAAVLVAVLLASCEGAPDPGIKRIRKSAKKVCTDKDQGKMSEEFNECINKFTQIHHENMGRAISKEDSQVSHTV